jgi:hypothetical protein
VGQLGNICISISASGAQAARQQARPPVTAGGQGGGDQGPCTAVSAVAQRDPWLFFPRPL